MSSICCWVFTTNGKLATDGLRVCAPEKELKARTPRHTKRTFIFMILFCRCSFEKPAAKVFRGDEILIFGGQLSPVGVFVVKPRVADYKHGTFAIFGGCHYHVAIVDEK